MSKIFEIPRYYRSSIISAIKEARRKNDRYKKDFSPSIIALGPIHFKIARHFGFCYGVENAIEITYRALKENPDKRIFLLSEMIHNSHVNSDLQARGIRFIMKTNGEYVIPFSDLTPEDIVIIPAFGTTIELLSELEGIGINPWIYNATCPFVEKVWKRSAYLGDKGFTIIIHGKQHHEETRATFSHSRKNAPSLIIRDIEEAELLAAYIKREKPIHDFEKDFPGRASEDFSPDKHLSRIGVVNQTTMLATETKRISDILKKAVNSISGVHKYGNDFADTRDTLCYATADNQQAVHSLIESGGDLAIVVGGYNSSNTSHLVELCANILPVYYIRDAGEILNSRLIRHLDLKSGKIIESANWLPSQKEKIEILITSGASCPDALVDQTLLKVAGFFNLEDDVQKAVEQMLNGSVEKKVGED